MVGNKLEQEIIEIYNKDIISLYSINQIATLLNKKYSYINKKVTGLIESNILKKSVIGKSHLCSINLDNDEAMFLLILNEIKKKKAATDKNQKLVEVTSQIHQLKRVMTIHLALVTSKKLIFVLEDPKQKNILDKSASINSQKFEVYTKKEFQDLLLDDSSVLKDHVILYGFEKYHHYVKEIDKMLKLKYSQLLK